jgi:N-acetylglucosamine-6-sulfatase
VGDNGLLEGEHGMVDKRTMHEPSIHIPLLVSGPGMPAGREIEQQVLTIDLASSLRELCGLPGTDSQGHSFVRLARQGDSDWRTAWFYEYNYEEQFPYTPNVRGVRTSRWKFIRYPHGDGHPDRHRAELYDLHTDPRELHNLADQPAYADLRQELDRTLAELQTAEGLDPTRDPLPLDRGIRLQLPDQKIR